MGKQQKKERVEKLKERKRNIEAAKKSEKKHKKAQVSWGFYFYVFGNIVLWQS